MTDKRRIVLMITAILAVAVIAFSLLYTLPQNETASYRDSIRRADEAYKNRDYESAVAEYKAAIEADQTAEDAYEGLANAYTAIGSYTEARNTLWTGYERTSSQKLYSLWVTYRRGRPDEESSSDNGPLALNRTLLTRIAGGTYQSYARQGDPTYRELQSDGSLLVRFPEVPGIMVFRNSTWQREAVSGNVIADDALPEEIRLDEIVSLLGGEAPYTRQDLESMGITDVFKTVDAQLGNAFRFTMDGCSVTVACGEDDTIAADAENVIVPVDALSRRGGGEITDRIRLTGTIIDAQTGAAVEGITVQFRGQGGSSGEISDVSVTGTGGVYEIDLPPGLYTVETGGAGYITEEHTVEIGENEIESEEDFVVTKELAEGEARLVLEWGETPTDLDSHLIGDTDSGSRIHIFFSSKSGSDAVGTIAELDLDDTSSYGPETTTIYNLSGKYEFYVHNYTPSTGTLEGSGATVTVYLPGQPVQTFRVGDGPIDGDTWYVCTIDHGKLVREGGTQGGAAVGAEKEEDTGREDEEPQEESPQEDSPQGEENSAPLTMEDAGLPYGLYEGYKHNTGDGAIEAQLQLNEDMTYRLQCIFELFGERSERDGDYYTYTGTYRVDRIDSDGKAVLYFENSVKNFEMKEDELGLDCEYFSARFPSGH